MSLANFVEATTHLLFRRASSVLPSHSVEKAGVHRLRGPGTHCRFLVSSNPCVARQFSSGFLSPFCKMCVDLRRFHLFLPSCLPSRSNSSALVVGEQEQPAYISTLTVPALYGTSTSHNTSEEHPLELYTDASERTNGAQQ